MKARKIAVLMAFVALALAACGGGASDSASDSGGNEGPTGPGDPVKGAAVYQSTCAACHGPDLQGIDGLGKQLAPSAWVAERSEEEITEFLIVGRAADDPENTQGVAMPARGGNPSLTDQDLRNVSAYLLAQQ